MKELSIEQKAKAYDEAIERAREWAKQPTVWNSEDICQKIFPELKESEDESIRKDIYIYLDWLDGRKDCAPRGKYTIKDMIAWLEKQSEQKPTRSEEDKLRAKQAIMYLSKKLSFESEKDDYNFREGQINWLKSLKDRVGCEANCTTTKEWSEEDSAMINKLLAVVDLYYNRSGDDLDKQSCISWLKSLRPQKQWKPSEEMLEALYRAVPENVMEISEDKMLLDKLYQGLKYGRVLSK